MERGAEGDKDQTLAKLDHWPKTELVDNEKMTLEAQETIWRDFYTGQRLYNNWSKPYFEEEKDTKYGDTSNCMQVYTDVPWEESWQEWECEAYDMSCPCIYPTKPLLILRGLCEESWIDKHMEREHASREKKNSLW